MSMDYEDQTIDEFLSHIASENITPAGGTAAAIVGAIGASLCEMVCIHTIGKEEDEPVVADMVAARDELRRQRGHLLNLARTDADVIDELFPIADDGADQPDIKRSIGVPITIADTCLNVLNSAIGITANGNRNAVADAGIGVFLADSALRASIFTARNNLAHVSNPSFINEINQRTAQIEEAADDAREQTLRNIEERT